jgi:8-oxo-dGTP pyrophosphatase MutT (NUDIX family)
MPLQRAIDNIKTLITGTQESTNTQQQGAGLVQKKAISAGAIILREVDGELKIALAQRKRKNKTWVIPKGHVEPGETIEQAALREIYEEAGLHNVQLIKYLGSLLRESVKSNGECVQKTIHYYLAYALDGKNPLSPTDKRFNEPGWFTPKQAIKLLPYKEEQVFFSKHLDALLSN